MRKFFEEYGVPLAYGPALAALLGSLYYSEIAGFVPCTLCWYQRILMYPLCVIILVGILSEDEYTARYVLPFSITGMAFSTYHLLLQHGVIGATTACRAGVPCNIRYINYFGFITIPTLALTAFTLISVSILLHLWAKRSVSEELLPAAETPT